MFEWIAHHTFLSTFIAIAFYWAIMLTQQRLAKELISVGALWRDKNFKGQFIGTSEGNYWLLFLFGLWFGKSSDLPEKYKTRCLMWGAIDLVTLIIIILLSVFLFWKSF